MAGIPENATGVVNYDVAKRRHRSRPEHYFPRQPQAPRCRPRPHERVSAARPARPRETRGLPTTGLAHLKSCKALQVLTVVRDPRDRGGIARPQASLAAIAESSAETVVARVSGGVCGARFQRAPRTTSGSSSRSTALQHFPHPQMAFHRGVSSPSCLHPLPATFFLRRRRRVAVVAAAKELTHLAVGGGGGCACGPGYIASIAWVG